MGEATFKVSHGASSGRHFNPRFPWGKRPLILSRGDGAKTDFNPRFPWGKRPIRISTTLNESRFQSTLPVGEATPLESAEEAYFTISIHASRGGSDQGPAENAHFLHISIHASRGGSDAVHAGRKPVRFNFNPRFPWGKRRRWSVQGCRCRSRISIHASRGGSDKSAI